MVRPTLILSDKDVAGCLAQLEMSQTVTLIEEVFRAHGQGRVAMPPKVHLDLEPLGIQAWMNAMPAYVAPGATMGLKWIGGFNGNPARGLPYLMGLIVLAEAATGLPVALMEGAQITSRRTGAAAGVAAKYLARPGRLTVAVIGAGAQGASALSGLSCALNIAEARVSDIDAGRREALAASFAKSTGAPARGVASPQAAVEGADVIVTATTASVPLVMERWVEPGALVITLGSYAEVETALVTSVDKLLVDNWAQAEHRGGLSRLAEEGVVTRAALYAELGDVVAGKVPGRHSPDERILCAEIGLGTEDLATAWRVYELAREAGRGVEAPLYV